MKQTAENNYPGRVLGRDGTGAYILNLHYLRKFANQIIRLQQVGIMNG